VEAQGATLAVSTPAQAFVLAGLVRLGSRRPVLVVTPTGAAAAQLAHDLEAFATGESDGRAGTGPRGGAVPGWETLPFERISPEVHTMGRRLRLLWALGVERCPVPDIVVAPVKAVLQRLGPWRTAARPVVIARGDQVWSTTWWPAGRARLPPRVAGRAPRRAGRPRRHRRRVPVDGRRAGAHRPVGDEVDRLTRFDVADQRSTDDLEVVELFGCRELVTDEAMRKRAADLVATDPWGRHQWTASPTTSSSTAWSRGCPGCGRR